MNEQVQYMTEAQRLTRAGRRVLLGDDDHLVDD